ncbi:MAG: hypothetical protein PVG51_00980 [Desulfosarcina sp.]|jgi:hypothetical protein
MIAAILYGLPCVLLLRWIIWGTTRLFEQEWELDHICNSGLRDSQDEARVLKCLLHNGLSE